MFKKHIIIVLVHFIQERIVMSKIQRAVSCLEKYKYLQLCLCILFAQMLRMHLLNIARHIENKK